MQVIVLGLSPTRSKGEMATVIEEIAEDKRFEMSEKLSKNSN